MFARGQNRSNFSCISWFCKGLDLPGNTTAAWKWPHPSQSTSAEIHLDHHSVELKLAEISVKGSNQVKTNRHYPSPRLVFLIWPLKATSKTPCIQSKLWEHTHKPSWCSPLQGQTNKSQISLWSFADNLNSNKSLWLPCRWSCLL